MKNIENIKNLNEEQSILLETIFDELYKRLEQIKTIVNITKEASIDVHGDINKEITSHDIENTLNLISDLITPISYECAELGCNANYMFWNKGKYPPQLWGKIEKSLRTRNKIESILDKKS